MNRREFIAGLFMVPLAASKAELLGSVSALPLATFNCAPIYRNGRPLQAGDIATGSVVKVNYDGRRWNQLSADEIWQDIESMVDL